VLSLREPPAGSFAGWLRELSSGARQRGFVNLLDASTFVLRADDLCDATERAGLPDEDRDWSVAHDPYLAALEAQEATSEESPLVRAFVTARAKVVGVQLLVDGSSLGSLQTGTQVGLLALIEALVARPDVGGVTVAVPGPIPGYARHLEGVEKVRFTLAPPGTDFSQLGRFDGGYRPIQPDASFDLDAYRAACRRVVVNVLDLIGYEIGAYHESPGAWLAHRAALAAKLAAVDGITTISEDVKVQLLQLGLPVEAERVFPVLYGTEHLRGDEPVETPAALTTAGALTRPFLLCLGTNYSHKNRDLARLAHAELVRRGHDIDLVLVGAVVPYGSSRVGEALAGRTRVEPAIVVSLPDVTAPERNWLLRHATAVLYPTSAEGFGLVPFEAAAFGTPTVQVAFGPLREIGGSPPVVASDWRPGALADATEQLLVDPALVRSQVEHVRRAGAAYSWAGTAEALVGVFRRLLDVPARRPDCP
jgi:glycosyltransferase involved in cell wall biosynthesis